MGLSPSQSGLIADIRKHYDTLSSFYQMLWGPHMHHGYWEGGESPAEAQVKLVRELASRLDIAPEHRVLDIGSGLGGSACWLAKTFGCSVLGLTLGAAQVQAAQKHAADEKVSDRVSFREHDANCLDTLTESFDRIWIVECSEHIHDKQTFFNDCARLLQPGGRLGLCAWLRGDADGPGHEQLVQQLSETLLCPTLFTMGEQISALETAGFQIGRADNIASGVLPTWEHCNKLVSSPMAQMFLYTRGSKLRRYVECFKLLERGYREGALAYGMIVATRE